MTRYGTQATPDRPEFEVRVDGAALEAVVQRDVVEIDVAEEVNRHGRLSLLVQNWDADTRTVRHSDDGPFAPGVAVEVLLGYHSNLESVFEGVVASVTAHFPSGGNPVLRVEGRSRSILLDHPPRSRRLADVSDEDVATAVAADYSLQVDGAAGVTRRFVVSDRRTDWDLLTSRAAELGWVVYTRADRLVLRPPASADAPVELEYGRNVTEVHLTQDLTHVAETTTASGWDVDALEPVESESGPSQAGVGTGDRPDHGTAIGDAGWPARAEQLASPALAAPDAADAAAQGRQRRTAWAHCYGHGSIVGNPALRCDQWLTVTGVGERMSGPHYVTAVRHRLSARGFVTEFQVGLPPRLLPPGGADRHAPRAGLLIGVVEDLDDPDGLNRAKVRMPWRDDGGEGVWARVATLDAGPDHGTVFVPDVDQEVLVGFVDDDPSTPVVLGSLVNGVQTAPYASDADNHVRAIVTPAGHRLVFDDGDDSAVTVETAKKLAVVLSDADGTLTLSHGDSGNTLTISADGIELKAAQGDVVLTSAAGKVKLDGTGIEGTSSGPAKLESSATFDLKASAVLGLKGSIVNIN